MDSSTTGLMTIFFWNRFIHLLDTNRSDLLPIKRLQRNS